MSQDDWAKTVAAFFKILTDEGLTRGEALQLTLAMMNTTPAAEPEDS